MPGDAQYITNGKSISLFIHSEIIIIHIHHMPAKHAASIREQATHLQ